jgi:hypothetical protein
MLMPTMDMEELVMELDRCKLALWGACDWAGRPPARHSEHGGPNPGASLAPSSATAHRVPAPKSA